MIFAFNACSTDGNYLIDGGISSPEVRTTTMDFFRSHSQLDTLAIIIERAGMEDLVNSESTIFAPNNLSIKNYVEAVLTEMRKVDPNAQYTVNDIPTDTLQKYMGGYIFNEKITRSNIKEDQGRIYISENNEERRISLEESDEYTDQLDSRPKYVYYTYKNGADWDDWNNINDDDKVVVKTSNLISTNGIIHVLQGSHRLFNYKTD
ncbi:fasciclin domain-containing protein [Tamlana sp. 2201CG12-4]|uniref:fasciclin domain-containing protein n=1 Tax=Tamlana sp. 2201CG12-4 TaxID=3112582 RepID=UPI002DBC434D|nr:fasciclin domain-containing protein [Tamlana sp. 2201CG12-4]MEC3908879.1 fasciclin domain-containing protein [Tamlana sp. 2201CG12-4]